MSYERQRTVKDGDELINRDDLLSREPTKGTLSHSVDQDGKAVPQQQTVDGVKVSNAKMIELLELILVELKIANLYNSMTHGHRFDELDIE